MQAIECVVSVRLMAMMMVMMVMMVMIVMVVNMDVGGLRAALINNDLGLAASANAAHFTVSRFPKPKWASTRKFGASSYNP